MPYRNVISFIGVTALSPTCPEGSEEWWRGRGSPLPSKGFLGVPLREGKKLNNSVFRRRELGYPMKGN